MKIKDLIQPLYEHFPLELQYDFDHCGLQIGTLNQDVDKALISLTCDTSVIEEAISQDIHCIITHHPFLFNKFNEIDYDTPLGNAIRLCIENHITVVSFHTCMDIGINESMNIWIAKELGLENISHDGLIVYGNMHTNTIDLCHNIIEKFDLDTVRYNLNKNIYTIAIVGGSGMSEASDLYHHVDCFITGDTKYHDMQDALEHQLCVIDAGHFLESIMVKKVAELLEKQGIILVKSKQKDYYHYVNRK